MRKNVLILAVIVIAAYLVGVESVKSRGKSYEDLRHQLERPWTSPDAKKTRKGWRRTPGSRSGRLASVSSAAKAEDIISAYRPRLSADRRERPQEERNTTR